ncbi:MAG: hypothetical protein CR982_03245 [Candidatus Cloacimonadota bacterium]|nr:MAG: hypothetical protein CR982_03245 [Candidatus Cloacimonadota bacterium]PIE77409.1 MAG: hypothetical protein CSA15_13085 [Candidatus Delongbacteria bacterium]
MQRILIIFILSFFYSLLGSSKIRVENIKELISNRKDFSGIITNLEVSPIDRNLITFEVNNKKGKDHYIVLYNLSSKKHIKIRASQIGNEKAGRRTTKYSRGVEWLPGENFFAFYGVGTNGKYNIYFCNILDKKLRTKFAYKFFKMEIPQNKKVEYLHPVFSEYGNKMYCTIKKNDDDSNIGVMENFREMFENKKFEGNKIKKLIDKNFVQLNPKPITAFGKEMIAYTSFTAPRFTRLSRNKIQNYCKYQIIIRDIESEEEYIVDNLDGFSNLDYEWSQNGRYFYYFKAIPKNKTPRDLIESKNNIVNLHGVQIYDFMDNFNIAKLKGKNGNILLEDISPTTIVPLNDFDILVTGGIESLKIIYFSLYDWFANDYNDGFTLRDIENSSFPCVSENKIRFINSGFNKFGRKINIIFEGNLTYNKDDRNIKKIEHKVEKYKENIEKENAHKKELKAKLNKSKETIKKFKEDLKEIDASTAYYNNVLETKEKEMKGLEFSLNDKKQRLSDLENSINLLKRKNGKLETKRDKELYNENKIEHKVEKYKENIEKENANKKEVKVKLDRNKETIKKLEEDLKEIDVSTVYYNDVLETKEKEMKDLEFSLDDKRKRLLDLENSINLLKRKKIEWEVKRDKELYNGNRIKILELKIKEEINNLKMIEQQIKSEQLVISSNKSIVETYTSQKKLKEVFLESEIDILNELRKK